MSETKHTPGPWRFYTEPQPNGCPIVGNGRGLMLAMLAHSVNYPDQRDEANANARLIAAAPDLLDTLRRVDISIVGCEANATSRKHWQDDMAAVKEMVRQTLRAAVGAA